MLSDRSTCFFFLRFFKNQNERDFMPLMNSVILTNQQHVFYKHILGLFQNIGGKVVQVVELSIFSGPAMQKVFQNIIPTSLRKQTINKVWSVPLSLYRSLWKERSREAASFRCRKKINCCSFTEFFCQIVKLQNVPFFIFFMRGVEERSGHE